MLLAVPPAMAPPATAPPASVAAERSPHQPPHKVVLYSGTERHIRKLPLMDSRHDCRGLTEDKARNHSGMHPDIRSSVRRQLVYAAIEREVTRRVLEREPQADACLRIGLFDKGGKHRSVSVAEELAVSLRARGHLAVVVHTNDHHWPCQRGECAECQESF